MIYNSAHPNLGKILQPSEGAKLLIAKYHKLSVVTLLSGSPAYIAGAAVGQSIWLLATSAVFITAAMALHAKSKARDPRWCLLIFLAWFGMLGILFLRDHSDEDYKPDLISKFNKWLSQTLVTVIGFICGVVSLIACCGYIIYDDKYGYRGPDSYHGIEPFAFWGLIIIYSLLVGLPTFYAFKGRSGIQFRGIFCFLNFFLAGLTIFGLLSLLF